MNRRIVSFSLMSTFLLFALVVAASAQTRTVGVSAGDTFKYSVSTSWSSNDPTATPPQDLISENGAQIQFAITAVSGTNVTAELTVLLENGTQIPFGGWIDVNTGDGENLTMFLISANLAAGDSIYNSSDYSAETINGTVAKTYSGGVTRETNYFNTTYGAEGLSEQVNFYWDKLTGIVVELSETTVNQTATYTTTESMDDHIISSSVWIVPEFPNWILPMLTLIALTSAVTLIARRKQTRRPLP